MSSKSHNQSTEIAIIGGGAAGLSAALTLTRARRRVIVIDDGAPRNAAAVAAHGLIGQEGVNPQKLLAKGREEVSSHGARVAITINAELTFAAADRALASAELPLTESQ